MTQAVQRISKASYGPRETNETTTDPRVKGERMPYVASKSSHVKFFGECENMRKLESRQHRCH